MKKNKQQKHVQQKPAKKIENPPIVNKPEHPCWKKLFWGIAAIILVLMMINASSVGHGGDDLWYVAHGKFTLNYFLDKDTTVFNYNNVDDYNVKSVPQLTSAGTGFEIIPAGISRIFHIDNMLLVKKFCLAFFGFLLILFTGLIGRELKDFRLGLLAMAMMFLTPNILGLSFCGGQDVPSATGFAMAIYGFLVLTKAFPKISIKGIIFSFLGITIATGVRVSGLMLLMYFFVAVVMEFIARKDLRQLFPQKQFLSIIKILCICLVTGIVAALIGLCAYPSVFHDGLINHVTNSFASVSKYAHRIPFIYDGKMAESTNPPEHYLLFSLLRTLPYYIFIGAALFLALFVRVFKQYRKTAILFLLFTALFPPIYIVASHANIYNGWRHLLFFYAPFAVLVSIGWYELIEFVKPKKLKETVYYPIVAGAMLLIVSPTLIWIFKNHNYIYCYYNKSVGNPYLKFELDYYETSATRAYDWLRENELNKTDSMVTVSTKIFTPVYYAEMLGDTDHVKVFTTSYMGFAETDCDYSIINYHVIQPKAIKSFFPPKGTIHVEYVDGNPICAVVKRNKLDFKGVKLCKEGKYAEAVTLLDSAYKYDPDNFGIWFWLGLAHYQTKDYEKSIEFFNKDVGFIPSEQKVALAQMYNGASLYELKRYDEAVKTLQDAEKRCTDKNNLSFIQAHIGLSYLEQKEYAKAIPYFKNVIPTYPFLANQLNFCMMNAK